jgi:hypothetical protein
VATLERSTLTPFQPQHPPRQALARDPCEYRNLTRPRRRSPWLNGHVEPVIGSIRRKCVAHIVVMGEASPCAARSRRTPATT